jgi:hypothetical protein
MVAIFPTGPLPEMEGKPDLRKFRTPVPKPAPGGTPATDKDVHHQDAKAPPEPHQERPK